MKIKEHFIVKLAGLLNINLLGTAYKTRGIGLPNDFNRNGELYFLKKLLPELLTDQTDRTFFDVGQNRGDYTQTLLELYPNAKIHGFEPNPFLTKDLQDRFNGYPNVYLNSFGLGKNKEKLQLFTTKENMKTGHGSIFKDVMKELHKNAQLEENEIELDTISNYCREQGITQVDFLKVDVEGNELSVLQGAEEILNQISVIQFEFNEMNIVSKSFLKDFYDLMPNFSFYRLLPKGLFPLEEYSSKCEVFIIHNIVAIYNR
jgi:FkbM family methyltransferase